MAGFLSEYEEVTRVTIGDRWWVDVRRYLNRGDFKAAQAVLIAPTMRSDGQETATTGAVDSGGYQNELVVRAIVDWNLTDDNDTPLPLNPDEAKRASVDRLPESVFEDLLLKIDGASAAQPAKEAAEKKAAEFPGPSVPVAVGAPDEDPDGVGPVPD